MNALKKTLNVFGIILAWFLSLALVALLIAAPTALSALSLLEPETITEAVWDALDGEVPSAAAPESQNSYGITNLSAQSGEKASDTSSADKILGELDVSKIEELIGEEIDEDVVNKIIASDAVKEILEAYTDDVVSAITGESGKSRFNAEKIIEVVDENINEIAEIIQQVAPDLSADDVKELKSEIKSVVRENADEIVKVIPAPQEIRDTIIGSGAEMEFAVELLAQRDNAKRAIVGAIVLLSLLIFLLRIPGFRGFRWLSVDLFVAGGFGALICVGLKFGSSVIAGLVDELEALEIVALQDIILNIVSAFTTGVMIRTGIILAAAIVLMVVYVVIKALRRKKAAKPVAVPAAVVSAPDYAPAPVTAEPVAEVSETPQEASPVQQPQPEQQPADE